MPIVMNEIERELTTDERMTWGDCPTCGAPHGEWCHAGIGLHIGRKANGAAMQDGDGAHLSRLNRAPFRVRLVQA